MNMKSFRASEGFCNVPARLILTFMGFLAMINAYTMRSVLNIAITEMVYRPAQNVTSRDDTCSIPGEAYVSERLGFRWSEQLQGVILGAFFWGYVFDYLIKLLDGCVIYFGFLGSNACSRFELI